MTADFHQLINAVEIPDAAELTIPRAQALRDAIMHQRDYLLVQLLRPVDETPPSHEYLIVEVQCDGVPPRNPVGIDFCERLALRVPREPRKLIEVFALRCDFPVLMHQNQGAFEGPASLCLYFEPSADVARTWTPQTFLRRIQWWLEKSAREELHPVDQPVEQLFFVSGIELVLPWNLEALRSDPGQRFVVERKPERPDGGFTCFLRPVAAGLEAARTFRYVELVLPPVVHGVIERDPETLGQLADRVAARGGDLMVPLRDALVGGVGQQGATISPRDAGTVIVLRIPICRVAGCEPGRVALRAFLLTANPLELGVDCGVLLKHEGRFYQDVLNPTPPTVWRDQPLMAMEVLKQNDAESARRQSGITSPGPMGTLVGAGSLGSAMLALWGRSGWGQWTVIDKDHIKPHNLSRHVAHVAHIGEPKVHAVAGLHAAALDGASSVAPVVADACDLALADDGQALAGAALVVDASTTLEYPRLVSGIDAMPRHFSVFLTPSGNGAVLLAEDARRLHRLRTLEAQYYRAVIEGSWGGQHLSGHVGRYWSGAGCRDISLVLPYSRIVGHASTLAEQIQAVAGRDDALIRIWQRDAEDGAVTVHDVPVATEQCFPLTDMTVYIDDGVVKKLRRWREEGMPHETGGVLLGYFDFNIGALVVADGLPAPTDSKSSPAYFERGIEGLAMAVAEAAERTAQMVRYIGEWHSHPRHCSAMPSTDDNFQLASLAVAMFDDGLPGVQLIVGENDLHIAIGTASG